MGTEREHVLIFCYEHAGYKISDFASLTSLFYSKIITPPAHYIRTCLLICIQMIFFEESPVFNESWFNVVIVHELRENIEFLPQKLVREVHLK